MKLDPFPVLETPRLVLREFRADDAEAIFALYSDPKFTEHMMNPITSLEEAQEIVDEYQEIYETGKGIVWAITLRNIQTVIGTCGFETISEYDHRGELGYDLSPAHWGTGLMSETLTAVLDISFTRLELHRIQAFVLDANWSSIKLLQKFGFSTEGVLKDYRWFKSRFTDWVLMSLIMA
jgi:ribosomal-protein-alanine N-acetyltransferase